MKKLSIVLALAAFGASPWVAADDLKAADADAVVVKLTRPQYRDNFYPGQNADRVQGRVKTPSFAP